MAPGLLDRSRVSFALVPEANREGLVTRALAAAAEHKQVLELVHERAALRRELETLDEGACDRPEERVA
jgi:hypothetical protein